MNDKIRGHRERLVERVLNGPGVTNAGARRAAFDNRGVDARAEALIAKVTRTAWKVTDADVAAAKAAGMAEDEIFELTVCAAIGQSTRQLESALAALDQFGQADQPDQPDQADQSDQSHRSDRLDAPDDKARATKKETA